MGDGRVKPVLLVVVVLGLWALQWAWLDWRWSRRFDDLRDELRYTPLGSGGAATPASTPAGILTPDRSEGRLRHAVERLASHNLIDRYQAGMVVREYGAQAVPALLGVVRAGSASGRYAALLILGDLRDPAATPGLRDLARQALTPAGTAPATGAAASAPLEAKSLAGVLAVLGRTRDPESAPLLRQALGHADERVRAAAAAGLRENGGVAALPDLVARLGRERDLVQRELEKTILELARRQPDPFVQALAAVAPAARFEIVKLLDRDRSPEVGQVLRLLTGDVDKRVALSAASILARRGDASGRDVAAAASATGDADLRRVAAEVLRQIDQAGASPAPPPAPAGTP